MKNFEILQVKYLNLRPNEEQKQSTKKSRKKGGLEFSLVLEESINF